MSSKTPEVFIGRGEFFVGNLDPYDKNADNADSSVIANAMRSLGIVEEFKLTPTIEQVKLQDWTSVNDSTADSWFRAMGGTLELLASEANPDNLALNLSGRLMTVSPESVSGAKIAYKDPTTKKYEELTDPIALKAGVGYYFVRSISDDGLSYDPYTLIDASTFMLSDSSATPKTLADGADYVLSAETGKLTLKGTTGHGINLSGLTWPLMADFDMGLFVKTIPKPLMANAPYSLGYKNISAVTVKDSSATPKVIPDDYYSVDADYGMIKITNKAAILGISGITLPLKVHGIQGSTKTFGLLSEGVIKKQVVLNGINARTRQKVVITLWCVSVNPSGVDFFTKDYTKVPLKFEIEAAPNRDPDDLLGPYGKVDYL